MPVSSLKGFTLVELVVSIGIFAVMTALVVARYGSFNQGTIITNVAFDMALSIRTAQTYGLSVKSTSASVSAFTSAYGIHFDMNNPTQFIFFADTITPNNKYDSGEAITTYTLNQSAKITAICLGSDPTCVGGTLVTAVGPAKTLDVTYKRPNPNAIFCTNTDACPTTPNTQPIAFITITSSDGTNNQVVYIRQNGQISVGN